MFVPEGKEDVAILGEHKRTAGNEDSEDKMPETEDLSNADLWSISIPSNH